MPPAAQSESADEVLASIRRIVAEENASESDQAPHFVTGQAAERVPVFSGTASAAKAVRNRRSAALLEARRRFEERMAEREVQEAVPEDDGDSPCKLLLTEDFQVRGPQENRVAFPSAPDAGQGYAEDSDRPEAEERPTLESVVRDAVADSVRAALNGAVSADEEPDMLDDDGYIDADTLRALVISIVHDELRGDLGSQISARVRKLVRQEINRSLQIETLGI